MLRSDRMKFAIGLTTCLSGFAVSYLIPVLLIFLDGHGFLIDRPGNMDDSDSMQQFFQANRNLAETVNRFRVGGLWISLCGFVFAYVIWVRWFVSPDNKAPDPGTPTK